VRNGLADHPPESYVDEKLDVNFKADKQRSCSYVEV